MQKRTNKKKLKRTEREKPEFEQKMVDLARVTRVTRGGKRLAFRALIVLGDKKGKVGYGVAKGKDVTLAVSKAVDQAKKGMLKVELTKTGTISHEIRHKFNSARIMLKPAPTGTGVKAGGPMRVILDLAGVENVVGKMMGSKNKINNVKATYEALSLLRKPREIKKDKGDKKDKNKKPEIKKGEIKG